jgi:hypothetical protein
VDEIASGHHYSIRLFVVVFRYRAGLTSYLYSLRYEYCSNIDVSHVAQSVQCLTTDRLTRGR